MNRLKGKTPTQKTYSTREVAELVGIHRVTLQHWIKRSGIIPKEAIPMGALREQKLYRWSQKNVEDLKRWKAWQYGEGRGRKPTAEREQRLKSKELRRARNRLESHMALLERIIGSLVDLGAGLGISPALPFMEPPGPNHLENAWSGLCSAQDELRKARSTCFGS